MWTPVIKRLTNKALKQPTRGVLRKRCSENMQQIYRRTYMRNVISIKMQSNFIEIKLQHGCSPVNLLHIFKTSFLNNTSGGMLLKNLRMFSSLYKWNCFLINECTEPKAKILGDFTYITCYKRKYRKLYTQGGFLCKGKSNCCATLSLKYKSLSYDAQVLTRFSRYIQELLIIWDLYLAVRKILP